MPYEPDDVATDSGKFVVSTTLESAPVKFWGSIPWMSAKFGGVLSV
ncbi:hypothetical protein pSalSNUABM01_098 [Salmonella phage pSal-SNUABM-01]|nr:hypothetical protein pSalSNUABM01_098 [Salmonella phage pSal-SNUABM-01]